MRKIAFIGDVHGTIDELRNLYDLILKEKPDEIWHLGDLTDRGPDSEAVVQFCIKNDIKGIKGNHCSVIVELFKAYQQNNGKYPTKNPDKRRTLDQLSQSSVNYLDSLPWLAVFDDIKTIAVHGGLIPNMPLHLQTLQGRLLCRLQLIHPEHPGETRWHTLDRKGRTEAENRAEGWRWWYEDHWWDYNVVFGHSVFKEPLIHQNPEQGKCIGIDTGCCFGGTLTAVIMPEMKFLSVAACQTYVQMRSKQED